MEAFALYLFKSVIWLSGFTLVFILFLRNERFFLLNRLYLISGILTSFFLPFISVSYIVVLPGIRNNLTDNNIATGIRNAAGYNNAPDFGLILLTLYLTGVIFVISMIIKQSKSVIRVIKKAELITSDPVKLIRTTDYTSSFSFFSYVFVNPSITDVETKEIMNHELVHLRQRHWVDLVLVELLCILQWFNPLVWIYIRFIRQNHEYLADEVALQRTSDPAIYKATLLNQIVGFPVVNLANSFNYSLNKKRFNMMKNIINSPYRKMKIFLILPVFAILLYAFAEPEYRYNSNNETDEPSLDVSSGGLKTSIIKPIYTSEMTTYMLRDTLKNLKGRPGSPLKPLAPLAPRPPVNPINNISIETVPHVPPLPPVNSINNTGIETVPPLPPLPPDSLMNNSSIEIPLPPPLKFRSVNGIAPLFIVDGITMTETELEKIDPASIESISVLKNKSGISLYGEIGKEGAIKITTKKKAEKPVKVVRAGKVKEPTKVVK